MKLQLITWFSQSPVSFKVRRIIDRNRTARLVISIMKYITQLAKTEVQRQLNEYKSN